MTNKKYLLTLIAAIALAASPSAAFASIPAASSLPATSIDATSAKLNGYFNPNSEATSGWFEFNSQKYGIKKNLTGKSPISISYTLTDLKPGTTYSFRIVAENKSGVSYGDSLNFKTKAAAVPAAAAVIQASTTSTPALVDTTSAPKILDMPTASTGDASSVSVSGAILSGSWGGNSNTTAWFEYGTSMTSLTRQTSPTTTKSKPGTIFTKITGLSSNTTYYFRLAAKNDDGETDGLVYSLRTASPDSTVNYAYAITNSASNIWGTKARLNGYADPNGSAGSYWFEYGTDQSASSYSSAAGQIAADKPTYESYPIEDLKPGATYYFRLVVQNADGITRGRTFSFDAPSAGPQYAKANSASAEASVGGGYDSLIRIDIELIALALIYIAVKNLDTAFKKKI